MRPNIFLVVLDTARADALEPYGAGDGASPAIAQLARRGAALPRMIAPANWTMPSHASMLAGELPRAIGLAGAPGHKAENCRPAIEAIRERLLQTVLGRAGYHTTAISCNAWISRSTGFDTGFHSFVDAHTQRQAKLHASSLRTRLSWSIESLRARADDGAAEAARVIDRLLDEGPHRPFFWFVNLIECHSPYMPPRPYDDLSLLQRLRVGEEARRHLTLVELWRTCLTDYEVPVETMGRMRHLYGRSIRLMDDWLARVLDEMDRRKILDDTIVILTSDHGENLGEEGLIGHSFSLDQRLIWIPFVAAGPVSFATDEVVSLAGLPRLIADAVGLDDHPWRDGSVPAGVAVSQYNAVAAPDDPRVVKAAADWRLDVNALRRMTASATSATDGRWKAVRHGDVYRFFNLVDDPRERFPITNETELAEEALLATRRLRRVIDAEDARQPEATAEAPPPPPAEEISDLEDRLRELGYL